MYRCWWSILFLTALACAQAPAGVPACAKGAVEQAIKASGCAASDKTCICNNEQVSTAVESASESCSEDDQEALFSAIRSLCDDGTQVVEEPEVQPGAAPVPVSEAPASEEQPQPSEQTPSPSPSPSIEPEDNSQATLSTPTATPSIESEDTSQATLSTPTLIATSPSVASEDTNQATLSTPTLIATHHRHNTTASTSSTTDTSEFSSPSFNLDDESDENEFITPPQDGTNPDQNGLTSATTTSLIVADDHPKASANATSSSQNLLNLSPHSTSPDSASPGSTSQNSAGLLNISQGSGGHSVTRVAARDVLAGAGGLVVTTVFCWLLA
ncbi:hypothetical protein Q7P37_005202 [Cladosporium fusiforme]